MSKHPFFTVVGISLIRTPIGSKPSPSDSPTPGRGRCVQCWLILDKRFRSYRVSKSENFDPGFGRTTRPHRAPKPLLVPLGSCSLYKPPLLWCRIHSYFGHRAVQTYAWIARFGLSWVCCKFVSNVWRLLRRRVFVFGLSLCATFPVELYSCCCCFVTTIFRRSSMFWKIFMSRMLSTCGWLMILLTVQQRVVTCVHFYHTPLHRKP